MIVSPSGSERKLPRTDRDMRCFMGSAVSDPDGWVGTLGRLLLATMTPDLRTIYALPRTPRTAIGVSDGMTTADWLALLGRVTTTWGGPVSTMYFPIDDWQRGESGMISFIF
jgi:hypothetical protein